MDTATSPLERAARAVKSGLAAGLKTTWFLVRIMVPVSLGVALLGWSGVLAWAAGLLAPAMGLIGLPGEAALVLLSSFLLNIYSAIAVMDQIGVGPREIAILAIMTLTAHNLIVETTVMKKTGSSATKMLLLRLGVAALAGWLFSRFLPGSPAGALAGAESAIRAPLLDALRIWGFSTLRLVLKVTLIVFSIMVAQRLLEEFRVAELLAKAFSPLMRFFGLSEESSFLWIVINVVGYAYGAAVIMERVGEGKMNPREADLFNHHAGICHSLLEDTALYAAIGVPILLLTAPRLALAVAVVWIERVRRHRFRRSFRVGTR